MVAYVFLSLLSLAGAYCLVLGFRKLSQLRLANVKMVSLSGGANRSRLQYQQGFVRGNLRMSRARKMEISQMRKPWGW